MTGDRDDLVTYFESSWGCNRFKLHDAVFSAENFITQSVAQELRDTKSGNETCGGF